MPQVRLAEKEGLDSYPFAFTFCLETALTHSCREQYSRNFSPVRASVHRPQVRLGEKEGLDSTLRFLEDRLGQLPRLEYYQERRLKSLGLLDDKGDTTYDAFFKDGVA